MVLMVSFPIVTPPTIPFFPNSVANSFDNGSPASVKTVFMVNFMSFCAATLPGI